MEERKKTTETEPCELQVGTGRPAARGIGTRRQGERGVSAGGWAGASIGPHLADRGSCPPCAVRSMLTTHPPCAGAWREPRARECAAAARATGAHVGLAQAASWGQAVAASRAGRQAVSKRRCRIGHAGRPISYLRARRHPKPSRLWQTSSQPPAYRSTREGGDVRRSSKVIWKSSQPARRCGQPELHAMSKFECGDSCPPSRRNAPRHEQRCACACVCHGRVREIKCISRLERYRHSDIAGSLPVQLRLPRKYVERPTQVAVPLV